MRNTGWDSAEISDLVGKTISDIKGAKEGDDVISICCSDGSKYRMLHYDDCCESVYVEDICGDVEDLIGSPVVKAEETTNSGEEGYGSYTWTFYHIFTIKGGICIRWYGSSNGYYSERVDFEVAV